MNQHHQKKVLQNKLRLSHCSIIFQYVAWKFCAIIKAFKLMFYLSLKNKSSNYFLIYLSTVFKFLISFEFDLCIGDLSKSNFKVSNFLKHKK